MGSKERNRCLDFIKGLACIGVVFMHCPFPSPYGQVVSFLFKFAVPIFFFISGYYSYNADSKHVRQSVTRKAKHILSLLLYSEGLYFLFTILSYLIKRKTSLLNGLITKENLLSAIFINKPLFNPTLWFLYALLFSYLLLYVVDRCKGYKMAYKAILVVLLGHVVVRTILKKINVSWYDVTYFRNALVYGFPMLLAGNLIRKYEMKCCNVTSKTCVLGVTSGTILTFLEYFLSRQVLDFYIGTLIASYFLFIYALNNKSKAIVPLIERIGCKLSLGVYVIHLLCIEVLSDINLQLGIEQHALIQWCKPIVCVMSAVGIVAAYEWMKGKVGINKEVRISPKVT